MIDIRKLVIEKVAEGVATSDGTLRITPDVDLYDIGLVDSLKAVVIMFNIEDAIGVEIPNEAIATCRTVNDIVELVTELVAEETP